MLGLCLVVAAGVYLLGHRQSSTCAVDAVEALHSPELIDKYKSMQDGALNDDNFIAFSRYLQGLYLEVSLYERDGKMPSSATPFQKDTELLNEFRQWVAKHISGVSTSDQRRAMGTMKAVLRQEMLKASRGSEDDKRLFAIRVKRMRSLFEKESRVLGNFFCMDSALTD